MVRLSRRTPLLSITPGTGSGPFGPGATDRVTFLGWRVLPDRRTLRRPGTLTPLLETPGRCDSRSSRSTRSRECRRSEEISAPLPPRLPQAGTVAIRKKKRGEEKRKKGSRFPVHRFGRDIKRIEPIQRRVADKFPESRNSSNNPILSKRGGNVVRRSRKRWPGRDSAHFDPRLSLTPFCRY